MIKCNFYIKTYANYYEEFKLENVFPSPVLLSKNTQFDYEIQVPGLLSRRKSPFVNANHRHQVIETEVLSQTVNRYLYNNISIF